MSDIPAGLADHLAGDVTTLCHCWRLTRRDGTVFGFTDHDLTVTCDGTTFAPETGLSASEATASVGLAADSMDVEGVLSSADIGEEHILAGLYDGATVETLLVNWQRPADFALLRKAVIGKITRRDEGFVAALESPMQNLDKPNGRAVRRTCDAELGDARCRFDTGQEGFFGAGSVASVEGVGILVVAGLESFASGWFSNGVLTWASGANAGLKERVLDHVADAGGVRLTLWRESPVSAETGDGFTVVAGCDKRFQTCKEKYSNTLNFRGFPHLPGNDAAYGYVAEDGNFDGGPIVK